MSAIEEIYRDVQHNTKLVLKSLVYTWRINKFSLLDSYYPKEMIYSPNFMIVNTPFRLSVSWSLENDKKNNALLVTLSKVKKDGLPRFVEYKVSLLDQNGHKILTDEDEKCFSDKERSGRPLLFRLADVEDLSSEQFNDLLIVRCEITMLVTKQLDNNSVLTKSVETAASSTIHKNSGVPNASHQNERKFPAMKYIFACLTLICMGGLFASSLFLSEFDDLVKCRTIDIEANNYIFDSMKKIISIAETLNLTELKRNSVDFFTSFKERHIPSEDLFKIDEEFLAI